MDIAHLWKVLVRVQAGVEQEVTHTILEPVARSFFRIVCQRNQLLRSENVVVRIFADASLIKTNKEKGIVLMENKFFLLLWNRPLDSVHYKAAGFLRLTGQTHIETVEKQTYVCEEATSEEQIVIWEVRQME